MILYNFLLINTIMRIIFIIPHFFLTFFYYNYFMSKLEKIDIQIKNAKVKSDIINKICFYFSNDYTAIQTAKQTGLSRQTINQYYKLIRTKLLEQNSILNYEISLDIKNKSSLEIKHINIYSHDILFIERDYGIYIINEDCISNCELFDFIKDSVKTNLINHKKANSARILYNKENKRYVVSGFFKSNNDFELFLQNRLKKFRGINKNNFITHLSESIFRYNHKDSDIYKEILKSLCN